MRRTHALAMAIVALWTFAPGTASGQKFDVLWNARLYEDNPSFVEVLIDATRGPSNVQVEVASLQVVVVDKGGQERKLRLDFGRSELRNVKYVKYLGHGVVNATRVTPIQLIYTFRGGGDLFDRAPLRAAAADATFDSSPDETAPEVLGTRPPKSAGVER